MQRPVQLLWTREDDFRHDQYHPCSAHRVRASLGPKGRGDAWEHRIVGSGTDGAILPYDIANVHVTHQVADPGFPTGIWRGVDHFPNAFVIETMIDELATLAEADPLEFRMTHLRRRSRAARVLAALSEAGAWPCRRRGFEAGLALHEMCNSTIAAVAEVEAVVGKVARVSRVTCAVDCGMVINPDGVRAQIEGGVAYGLSAAVHGGVTLRNGIVESANFDDYRILRIDEMPDVRVIIVPSKRAPGGIGEIAVPVIAPAVANALFRVRGERLRSFPFDAATEPSAPIARQERVTARGPTTTPET
jgi:isoquinoline 1-oxidoreductase beta subunit